MAEINEWSRAHRSPIAQELLKIRISVSAEDDYLQDILAELNLNSEQELYPRANALMLEALESGDGFTIERAWQTYAGMIKGGAVGVRYPEEWAYSPASIDRVGMVVGTMAACEVFSGCQVQSVLPEMMCMRAWTLCVPPGTSSFAFMMQRLVPPSDQPLMRDVYNWYLEIFQSGAFDRLGLYVNPEFQGGG